MNYTTSEAATIFSVKSQTILRWADEFAHRLDTDANPGDKLNRMFTDLDLRKLALVQQMKSKRRPFAEIDAALLNGEIADPPDDVTALALVGNNHPKHLQKRIEALQIEISNIKSENIGLKADKLLLQQQLEAKEKEARDLLKKLWQNGIE